jgi:hypothetical protein
MQNRVDKSMGIKTLIVEPLVSINVHTHSHGPKKKSKPLESILKERPPFLASLFSFSQKGREARAAREKLLERSKSSELSSYPLILFQTPVVGVCETC